MVSESNAAAEVYSFWFKELTRKDWFVKNEALDETLRRRFLDTHLSLARGEIEPWRKKPQDWLSAIVVLDQFSRNMFRGTPLAFAADWIALREARLAVEAGADRQVSADERAFFYLPFEHSEDLADQDLCVELFAKLGDAEYLDYAERHRAVIREFSRFPHRNAILGRESTNAELDYLAKPGAGF
ncbi:DUF924 domain-containing protein [Rhizobium sp. NTR19]|uniref:DUF924 domain-containing protein n=1 Tax=Neorhizobium turbinariae TaxID=2937795 RepID=A0ABT0IT21_9HYPH|nr:DUF924 family protein [Neorhizobium turbinariae]MCK8781032.1 DUF924 domain-containing protein [Neorhizobium turbinariae]